MQVIRRIRVPSKTAQAIYNLKATEAKLSATNALEQAYLDAHSLYLSVARGNEAKQNAVLDAMDLIEQALAKLEAV